MSAMASPAKINLDLDLGYTGEDEERAFTTVELLGEDFRILHGINQFQAMAVMGEDSNMMQQMMIGMVHGQDRPRFKSALGASTFFIGEEGGKNLVNLFVAMAEVAAGERPTKRSSGSSRSKGKTVAVRRSAAGALPAGSAQSA